MLCPPAKMKHTPTCNDASLNPTKFLLLLAVKRCCVQEGGEGGGQWGLCKKCMAVATKRNFVQCMQDHACCKVDL